MKTLCTMLFVCITWSLQAMAEGDTTLSRLGETSPGVPEDAMYPAAAKPIRATATRLKVVNLTVRHVGLSVDTRKK